MATVSPPPGRRVWGVDYSLGGRACGRYRYRPPRATLARERGHRQCSGPSESGLPKWPLLDPAGAPRTASPALQAVVTEGIDAGRHTLAAAARERLVAPAVPAVDAPV